MVLLSLARECREDAASQRSESCFLRIHLTHLQAPSKRQSPLASALPVGNNGLRFCRRDHHLRKARSQSVVQSVQGTERMATTAALLSTNTVNVSIWHQSHSVAQGSHPASLSRSITYYSRASFNRLHQEHYLAHSSVSSPYLASHSSTPSALSSSRLDSRALTDASLLSTTSAINKPILPTKHA